MKFKIGQKVRVKEWSDMPQRIQEEYSKNTCRIGNIGVVTGFFGREYNINTYDIKFEGIKCPLFFLEPELEPLIRIGEQLMFVFMLE